MSSGFVSSQDPADMKRMLLLAEVELDAEQTRADRALQQVRPATTRSNHDHMS